MRIGFDVGHLCERGTCVAVYDYAHHGREILGFEPIVFFDAQLPTNALAHQRFSAAFELVSYDSREDLLRKDTRAKLDFFYVIKSGFFDEKISPASKTLVHCVFRYFEPHGDVYAYVSDWLSREMTGGLFPAVPHIVSLPSPTVDLRKEIGIPDDAVVIGRHGGYEEFDLAFAHTAVAAALNMRKDLYFLFVNTRRFCDHERAIFLPPIVEPSDKSNFINACDAGIHARSSGESFGLAIAEFLYFDKPVIAWAGGVDRNHIAMIGAASRQYFYKAHSDLARILADIERVTSDGRWKAAVHPYSPKNVMGRFDKVFLKGEHWSGLGRPSRTTALRRNMSQKVYGARSNLWQKGIAL